MAGAIPVVHPSCYNSVKALNGLTAMNPRYRGKSLTDSSFLDPYSSGKKCAPFKTCCLHGNQNYSKRRLDEGHIIPSPDGHIMLCFVMLWLLIREKLMVG